MEAERAARERYGCRWDARFCRHRVSLPGGGHSHALAASQLWGPRDPTCMPGQSWRASGLLSQGATAPLTSQLPVHPAEMGRLRDSLILCWSRSGMDRQTDRDSQSQAGYRLKAMRSGNAFPGMKVGPEGRQGSEAQVPGGSGG